MNECPSLAGCPFFNDRMENKPSLANLLKDQYCKGDYTQCARFTVSKALGKSKVPDNMYPNMMVQAKELIGSRSA